ncbi:MAG: TonB-dependent receptor [Muribaculaceae bacterium]|nr:TonB-dependent receptor [Muribaculaceae bacterium]
MKKICFQLNRKLWLTLVMLLGLTLPGFAQKITVHGYIDDDLGEPLIGATVMEKGTTNGTATDIDGNFTLNVEPQAILVVSYVGYDPMEVAVNGRTDIKITMQQNAQMLAETVVIGYGSVKKSDATGSVAVVKPDEIEAGLATSVQDMLVGQTPGVVVTTAGGPEGSATIRIRGGSSLNASNDPLIVVDGVPLSNSGVQGMGNSLSMINPENVESMTILKDASATAIYGSRASNGVIIITTKKGKSGKAQVNFAANFYVNTDAKRWKVLSGEEFTNVVRSRFDEGSDALGQLFGNNTNWQDQVLRTTFSSDYTLSVGGKAGFLPYRVSASYTNSNGILKTSSMDRLTLGFNLSPKFFEDHLSINANANGYYIKNHFGDSGAVSGALSYNPTAPVYNDQPIVGGDAPGFGYLYNGYFESYFRNTNQETGVTTASANSNSTYNPLGQLMNRNNVANVWRSTGNIQFDYSFHFLPELHANLNLGYDVTKSDEKYDIAANSFESWRSHDSYGGGYGSKTHEFTSNTLLDFYLNYKKEWEEAANQMLDVTAGYSWQRFHRDGSYSGSNGNGGYRITPGLAAPVWDAVQNGWILNYNESTKDLVGQNFQDDAVSADGNYHWAERLQLLSFFGRVNYGLLDRYLLTVTVRGDATSRFSKNNRWGIFPSVALAWKINNEHFLERASGWLSDLKLRLGWGQTGQQDVGSTINYMALYSIASPTSWYIDGRDGWFAPAYPQGYNPNLKWETTTTYNVGLDFGFMNNRISGSIEWYKRDTKDLLAFVTVPAGMSTTNMLNQNIGTLENYGVEFNLSATAIQTEDFVWTLNYNVGWNHNEITELSGNNAYVKTGGISGGNGNTVQVHAVGHPANSFYLYQQVYDQYGQPVEGVYVDQNADGQIDDNDLVINHSPTPKVTMTFGSSFRWKNWDLGFSLRASIGNYVYNNVLSTKATYSQMWMNSQLANLVKTDYYFENTQLMSDYYLRNASFLRCDNITLGYTWNNLLNDNLKIRLFGGVQNPFVISKYNGIDPEVSGGIDNSVYPRSMTFSLGLVATF